MQPGLFVILAGSVATVVLMAWKGYHEASADWVFGFLAVFWSLAMMLRIMALTAPANVTPNNPHLAQKIINTFRVKQEENRQAILDNSFGGSYIPFLFAGLLFAAWQVFCAANPAAAPVLGSLATLTQNFLEGRGESFSWTALRTFDWGQGFLLFLTFFMMGFVLRSHAGNRSILRLIMLILSGYAVAGYILFAGLKGGAAFAVLQADFIGNGTGAASYLLGSLPAGKTISAFDIVLLESGIAGVAILAFLLFIPLGYISLTAQNRRSDMMVSFCGIVLGSVLILSLFLPFTPALGGLMSLCCIGVFMAWGHAENAQHHFT